MGFGGNVNDYYSYKNSLLSFVLLEKKGIPLSLAILYSCICRRIGISVDIIGLPGHVVVGIPGERRLFVDVYHQGRLLTEQDCHAIAQSYGFPWQDSLLRPLSPTQVFTRILNNLGYCFSRQLESGGIRHLTSPLEFNQRVMNELHQLPVLQNALLFVERFASGHPLFIFRDLLVHFGLLPESPAVPINSI
jgi:hypothetical protein